MSLKCTGERCPFKELTEGVSICTAHDCPYRTEPVQEPPKEEV